MSGLVMFLAITWLSLFFLPGLNAFHDPDNPNSENLSSIENNKFVNIAVNAAMDLALHALNHIKLQESKSKKAQERAALSDCWKFYDFMIRQLNQILDPGLNSTSLDIQTWLSAGLTSIENCQTTMIELNVTNSIPEYGFSELISNGLAINGEFMKESSYQKGFPSWLSDRDLRILQPSEKTTKFVVAQDGSGNFRTIMEALNAASNKKRSTRIVIHIRQGTYHEYVEIGLRMKNIMLVGDGIGKTIITGNRSYAAGYTTYQSSTVKVLGDGFVARDITFRNTAGPGGSQAVALFSNSDLSAFYRCAFEGYQDTLWANANRQFYKDCHIYGTIDFIFGDAAAVFQNNFIYARKPKHGQSIVITAQGRSNPNETTGFSIINCKVQAGPDLKPVFSQYKAYLGRPWKKYSRTVYLESFLDSLIDPLGWTDWTDHSGHSTVYYGEYGNYGPGSSTKRRVKWPGYRIITDVTEARKFSVAKFIDGQVWLPETGVPFSTGI
ncbi:Pectinesterase [Handroanthus impetiginosus]|uniref:Pectinesterase n=1 Tax=Handroanthus impetiginosus TaxID=429701 RepID=A0A2G9GSD3_9LAMI|nr:Pectinesterase [Handroanthus impetiginosus]